MTPNRDTLAAIIHEAIRYNFPVDLQDDERFKTCSLIWANVSANAVIAAGWEPTTGGDDDVVMIGGMEFVDAPRPEATEPPPWEPPADADFRRKGRP